MSKIQSIFGVYSQNLQGVIDLANDRFAPTWYQKYFDWSPAQQTLNFTSVIGASRIEAAASIVDRSSGAPLRSRAQLAKYQGEIPAIKEKFSMRESDYRDFLALQALSLDDATKKQQLLDFLFQDVQKAGNSAHKRLDIMVLQAVSTGKISLTAAINPDGIVLKNDIDLLMPSGNKSDITGTANRKWRNPTTATPITDITTVVNDARSKGRNFSKILLSMTQWLQFAKCTETINSLVSFNQLQKGAGIATLSAVNTYLQANLLPVIEIVDEVVGIEKDGVIGTIRPWKDGNVSFVPSGVLGSIKNAVCMEQMQPVQHVNYATFNRALISKWQENDPWAEFTAVELNAFPAFEAIDNVFILTVD
ncbi:MAG: major capsid protein [Paludibacter sp.]